MNIYSCAPFNVIRAMNVLVFVALPAHVCWSSSMGHLFVHLWVSTPIRGSGLIGFCYYKSAEGPRWGQSMTPPSRVRYRYLHAPSSHAIKCIRTAVRIVATHHWPVTTVLVTHSLWVCVWGCYADTQVHATGWLQPWLLWSWIKL